MMTSISSHDARRQFGELIERAFYTNDRIQVKRNRKAMAWIVGDPFMAHIHQLIDYIIEHQPALADSLALELDDELRASIDESVQQAEAGEAFPLTDLLNEL